MFDFITDETKRVKAEKFQAQLVEMVNRVVDGIKADEAGMEKIRDSANAGARIAEVIKPSINTLRLIGNPALAHRYRRYCGFVLSQCEEGGSL